MHRCHYFFPQPLVSQVAKAEPLRVFLRERKRGGSAPAVRARKSALSLQL